MRIVKGQLVAVPFQTSKRPFVAKADPSDAFGSHNPVFNRVSRNVT